METTSIEKNEASASLKPLTLEADAFNALLQPIVGNNKVGWTGDDHQNLVEGLVGKMRDSHGNPPELTPAQWDLVWACIRPSEAVLNSVIRQAFSQVGCSLGAGAADAMALVVSHQQFADFLAKTVNPATGKPFIVKEAKRGAKQSKFASLISAATAAPDTASSEADQKGETLEAGTTTK